MATAVKVFSDGKVLEYDWGKFDEWCVYLRDPQGKRKPPRDIDYFKQMKELAQKYGPNKIYSDYVCIYEITGNELDDKVLDEISALARRYEESIEVDVMYSILYMAMVSEERKRHTKLGKRIKRLGVHGILIENLDVYRAANYMKGMGWREISNLCEERGF